MASHFQTYVANFNRVRLGELIDFYIERDRMAAARPSLVINPMSGTFYDEARNQTDTNR